MYKSVITLCVGFVLMLNMLGTGQALPVDYTVFSTAQLPTSLAFMHKDDIPSEETLGSALTFTQHGQRYVVSLQNNGSVRAVADYAYEKLPTRVEYLD